MAYFEPLQNRLKQYLNEQQIADIHAAYKLAVSAHSGQKRQTGEDYITHPVAVSCILAEMRMDPETICAALLHDVIEDTPITKTEIQERFGPQVAELVDGVSKLTQIQFESRKEAQAENFRKMILAMTKDLRVIFIKLADRLHNMQTLSSLSDKKRKRIALETLEIYAPIANRLGMRNICTAYEEHGFAVLHPLRYRALSRVVNKLRGDRDRLEIVSHIEGSLREKLKKYDIPLIKLWGREKHLYSIYQKMRYKKMSFSEIMDVFAFRIITKSRDHCYRILGVVHELYKPVPERFKDYIAIPKANGYQSLHTTLFGPSGFPIEIQIRTAFMDEIAESGVASHWLYKSEPQLENKAHVKAQAWLKNLIEMQQSSKNSLEFIENVKIDLFPDEVYVFTPKGDIMELPNGASAIDFAYSIHTDIGNTAVFAKIDRRIAPLSAPLINGQTIEIITAQGTRPNPAWLNFIATAKARTAIRHRLKQLEYDESISLGTRLLERALNSLNVSLDDISEQQLNLVLQESHFQNRNELLAALGLGELSPLIIARRLAFPLQDYSQDDENLAKNSTFEKLAAAPLLIQGTEGMVVRFAHCCHPIPGDPIIGILEAGRGISVHKERCHNIQRLRQNERCIFIAWSENLPEDLNFQVEIKIELINRRGVLAHLAQCVTEADANIENVIVSNRDGHHCAVTLTVSVRDRVHLARVMKKLRNIPQAGKLHRL